MTTEADLDASVRRVFFSGQPKAKSRDPDLFRNILALFVVASFVGSLPILMFKLIPEGNKETIVYILGQLSGIATTVLGFYFVSKSGQDKLDAQRVENTQRVIETMGQALSTPSPQPVQVVNPASDPVPVEPASAP